ncbi:lipoyl protein ligase domain-containing protein, partial [Caminibacter sp.]
MCYFIFKVKSPAIFYRNIIKIFKELFFEIHPEIYYDIKRPGFYIQNRKIASLGFNYKKNISKHGVSIHLNPDLKRFNTIKPCNLEGIVATSLKNEAAFVEKRVIIKKVIELTTKYLGKK